MNTEYFISALGQEVISFFVPRLANIRMMVLAVDFYNQF